jgi:hypothetical protein
MADSKAASSSTAETAKGPEDEKPRNNIISSIFSRARVKPGGASQTK